MLREEWIECICVQQGLSMLMRQDKLTCSVLNLAHVTKEAMHENKHVDLKVQSHK